MADKSPEKRDGTTGIAASIRSFRAALFEKNTFLFSFCIILAMVAIAYGRSLQNGFVWDDETFIVNNRFVYDLHKWPQYFTNPESVSSEPVLSRMYRPVQTLSFALDAAMWNKWPGGFHLTSLFLHIAACLAVIFGFRTITGTRPAVIGAFIFAIHPALSEGALSLASRGNQLYALFGLLSLGFFVRIKKTLDGNHIAAISLAALSLFSKEPAIAILAVLPLLQAGFKRPWDIRDMRSVFLYLPFAVTAIVYLLIRSKVVNTMSALPYWGGSLGATIMMQSKVFVIYLRLLLWPFHLKGRYTIDLPSPFPDTSVIGAIILNLSIVILGVLAYRRDNTGKFIALSIAWFYISLAPVANLIPLPGSMMGERFLYFTFAGVIPLIISSAENIQWKRFQPAVSILATGIIVLWLTADIQRTAVWKNNKTFFTLLSKQEPDNPAVQLRMAQLELASDNFLPALERLQRIMKFEASAPLPEDRAKLHYWYGKALMEADRPREAYLEFRRLAEIEPRDKAVALLLSEALARSGDLSKARITLEQAIGSYPDDDTLWNGLGNISMMAGDIKGAISSYKRALEINAGNKEAFFNLQNALSRVSSDTHQNKR